MPVSRSQDARVVSAEAEKIVLLERDQERSRMAPLCPVKMPWLGQVPVVCQRRMVRSMLPEARWGVVGENRAQKTSAVWPDSSIIGAWSPLVRGTACIRAPELVEPLVTATALPLMSALDFCRFTTNWEDPKEFEAGRFAADMLVECAG